MLGASLDAYRGPKATAVPTYRIDTLCRELRVLYPPARSGPKRVLHRAAFAIWDGRAYRRISTCWDGAGQFIVDVLSQKRRVFDNLTFSLAGIRSGGLILSGV